jgi:pyridoxamine 5'-phosphate oxidase
METDPPIAFTTDPFQLFAQWFADAAAKEGLPEAMSLATVGKDGRPAVRMVLLKDFGSDGFVFYTNTQSRKGREIAANPNGALCLYWKTISRSIRIEGVFTPVTTAEADAYFESRPRDSQLAAWASSQSEILSAREILFQRFAAERLRYENHPVPRPPQWSGYRLRPDMIEFWMDVPNRLHDRLVFEKAATEWKISRLYP